MDFDNFSRQLIALNETEIILYINSNRSTIKTLFLKEWDSVENKRYVELILKTIATKNFSQTEIHSIELQSLYIHLAYYFKRINAIPYLSTCYSKIVSPYFKLRLQAFNTYKKHHTYSEHISQLKSYLELLTLAQDEVDDGNYNELLSDLSEYVTYANLNLSPAYREKFNEELEGDELQNEFNILKLYHEKNSSHVPGLEVTENVNKEFEPTDFAGALFEEKFLKDIRIKSQPYFPQRILGYPSKDIRYDIIGCGQTDFDSKYENLEASDRVNLYCYFNMRMHFFSSLSLFEKSMIADKYYDSNGKIKFIDIGCGPATSGIAFADYIHTTTSNEAIFDYYGIDVANNMLNKANDILSNTIFNANNSKKLYNSIELIDLNELKGANCIIINCCYVFASLSLPYQEIAKYINGIVERYPYVPKYIMFQNPVQEKFNKNYEKFKELLKYSVELTALEKIKYHTQQNSYFTAKEKDVYFEILRLL